MNTDRDVTSIVRSWLDEGVTQLPDRVLDAVLDQVPTTPQRRAWWPTRRFPLMNNNTVRFGVAAAAVVLAVFLGIRFIGPNVGNDPESTATPIPISSVTHFRAERNLDAGTYVLEGFPVEVSFDVQEGWYAGRSGAQYAIMLGSPSTPEHEAYALAFWIIDNVFVDPCDAAAGELDPPLGPSVDDLVAALSNLPGFRATTPIDVTVSGFPGKQIDLTGLDSGGDCPQALAWRAGAYRTDMGAGEMRRLQILDVDGVRLVVMTAEPVEADAVVTAEFREILDSIRIVPPS